jgi:hypothetical protein
MGRSIFLLVVFLTSGVLALSAEDLPEVELENQFGAVSSLREVAGPKTLVLVYRARGAADDAGEHYRIAREELDESTVVLRLADLSRVPKVFRNLAVRTIKKDAGDIPYYLDLEGNDVEAFGVEENEVGLFYYKEGRLFASGKRDFRDKEDLRKALRDFIMVATP